MSMTTTTPTILDRTLSGLEEALLVRLRAFVRRVQSTRKWIEWCYEPLDREAKREA